MVLLWYSHGASRWFHRNVYASMVLPRPVRREDGRNPASSMGTSMALLWCSREDFHETSMRAQCFHGDFHGALAVLPRSFHGNTVVPWELPWWFHGDFHENFRGGSMEISMGKKEAGFSMGTSMVLPLPWTFHGDCHAASMALPGSFHGDVRVASMGFSWNFHGTTLLPLGLPWKDSASMTTSAVLPWEFRDEPLVLPWDFHAASTGCPWCIHGVSHGIPRSH